jgi:hypothetical protein
LLDRGLSEQPGDGREQRRHQQALLRRTREKRVSDTCAGETYERRACRSHVESSHLFRAEVFTSYTSEVSALPDLNNAP